jgi:hypothetical protein
MTWLQQFYFLRAGVAVAWIALVVITAPASLALAGALLVLYPAWDALMPRVFSSICTAGTPLISSSTSYW